MHPVSTQQLSNYLKKYQLIDVRSTDAYNGWIENDEQRGGHIPGAKSLPIKWLKYIDWPEIVTSKLTDRDRNIVVYGNTHENCELVANKLKRLGYNRLHIYDDFIAEWTTNNDLPLDYLSRYKNVVSAKWLKEVLDTGQAPELSNKKYVLCHAHYRNRSSYDEGHIPGAIEIDTNTLESSETWNRRSPEELKEALEAAGIDSETTVILYGRFSFPDNGDPFPGSSAGHLGAIRAAAIMMYAGVKDVRLLNGGLQSWLDEGYKISEIETPKKRIKDFGVKIPALPNIFIDTPEAQEVLKNPTQNLVSVRSWPEFIGEVSGYNYIKKKGRIPGAVFGNCGSDAYHMENYRNLDHTMREASEIEKLWSAVGVTKNNFNAFYCGTGWRGSEAFFNAWLMGWRDIAIYDGGWFEWSNLNLPFATGELS